MLIRCSRPRSCKFSLITAYHHRTATLPFLLAGAHAAPSEPHVVFAIKLTPLSLPADGASGVSSSMASPTTPSPTSEPLVVVSLASTHLGHRQTAVNAGKVAAADSGHAEKLRAAAAAAAAMRVGAERSSLDRTPYPGHKISARRLSSSAILFPVPASCGDTSPVRAELQSPIITVTPLIPRTATPFRGNKADFNATNTAVMTASHADLLHAAAAAAAKARVGGERSPLDRTPYPGRKTFTGRLSGAKLSSMSDAGSDSPPPRASLLSPAPLAFGSAGPRFYVESKVSRIARARMLLLNPRIQMAFLTILCISAVSIGFF